VWKRLTLCISQISVQNWARSISAHWRVNSFSEGNPALLSRTQFRIVQSDQIKVSLLQSSTLSACYLCEIKLTEMCCTNVMTGRDKNCVGLHIWCRRLWESTILKTEDVCE
jgi:hypothetical protein